jgi:hypothetical protein
MVYQDKLERETEPIDQQVNKIGLVFLGLTQRQREKAEFMYAARYLSH